MVIYQLQFNLTLKKKQRGSLEEKESLNCFCEVKGIFVNVKHTVCQNTCGIINW